MIKVAIAVFGVAIIIFSSVLSGIVCKRRPKMLGLFCTISGVVAFVTVFVLMKG